VLSVHDLGKNYDGNPALVGVSFEAAPGSVVAICGENGAGKSTLMKILSGAIRPDTGEVRLDGKRVDIADPHQAMALGIQTVYQELSLLPHISVAENILLGKMPHRRAPWIIDWRETDKRAAQVLSDFGFQGIDVRTRVSDLSVSVQQIVEIAKAIAVRPRVLILDEPSAVLSARETDLLFAKIRQLTATGAIVLYISHRLEEVFEIADKAVVLKDGRMVLEAPVAEVDRERLITAMVGRSLAAIYPDRSAAIGETVLEVRDLTRRNEFTDVSFSVRRGEIVGMFGLVGSGRTEVAKAIFGAEPATAGEIRVDGELVAMREPADAIRHGVVLVTEDRKRDGLAIDLSVLDNGGLASMRLVSHFGVLDRAQREKTVGEMLDEIAIRPRGLKRPVRQLSGGNQQKVVLAKWLLVRNIRVFVFDEPTRGVDIATKVEIYRIMADLAAGGIAILLISSEMPEILGMSDRVLVMRGGRIAAELDRTDLTMETVFAHAAGIDSDRIPA
jgi:ABC-type sugar transport system ATPase subunit